MKPETKVAKSARCKKRLVEEFRCEDHSTEVWVPTDRHYLLVALMCKCDFQPLQVPRWQDSSMVRRCYYTEEPTGYAQIDQERQTQRAT